MITHAIKKGQTVFTETTLRHTNQESYEAKSKDAALTHSNTLKSVCENEAALRDCDKSPMTISISMQDQTAVPCILV